MWRANSNGCWVRCVNTESDGPGSIGQSKNISLNSNFETNVAAVFVIGKIAHVDLAKHIREIKVAHPTVYTYKPETKRYSSYCVALSW